MHVVIEERSTKTMLDIVQTNLPKNVNGFRTTHTCELCGFEPKTKNKYREKQDHLVMKHFKEKIDKIFPHCRPYSCPSPECSFTGKDKQALLRHYTGKHGILEKYLREALAEKGISYVPGDHGSKRKHNHNHDHQNGHSLAKTKKLALPVQPLAASTTIIDAKDMLPKSPVPIQTSNGTSLRPNSEELRKEVEAMMASFQPQPQQEAVTKVTVPNLPTTPVPVMTINGGDHSEKKTVILSSKLPVASVASVIQPPSSVVNLIKRSDDKFIMKQNGTTQQIHIPELIMPHSTASGTTSNGLEAVPIEIITTIASNGDSNNQVVENEEVMWGANLGLGPAVVVEAADTVPVAYIEQGSEIVTFSGASAAALDNIDYDYLYHVNNGGSVITTSVASINGGHTNTDAIVRNSAVRERQLEFNML